MVKVLMKILLSLSGTTMAVGNGKDTARASADDDDANKRLRGVLIRMGANLKAPLDLPCFDRGQPGDGLIPHIRRLTADATTEHAVGVGSLDTPLMLPVSGRNHPITAITTSGSSNSNRMCRAPLSTITNSNSITSVSSSSQSKSKRRGGSHQHTGTTVSKEDSASQRGTSNPPTSISSLSNGRLNRVITNTDSAVFDGEIQQKQCGWTQSLGCRRLLLEEIIRLTPGALFYLVIPTGPRREDNSIRRGRNEITKRLIKAFIASRPDKYAHHPTKQEQYQSARDEFLQPNTYALDGRQYIELQCRLINYPHRDDYVNDTLSETEIAFHIRHGGGLTIELVDFHATGNSVSTQLVNTMTLEWPEILLVQFYVQHFRGDPYPKIALPCYRSADAYSDVLESMYKERQDDYLQTLELKSEFDDHRIRILTNDLLKADKKLDAATDAANTQLYTIFMREIDTELANGRLVEFAKFVDKLYEEAWRNHFSGFQSSERLLNESIGSIIYKRIETDFPFHHAVLCSLIFGNGTRAHQPSVRSTPAYAAKQKALVNYFLGLVRQRNCHYLMHWAMMGTLAMYGRGVPMKYFQNPIIRSYTACLPTTLKHTKELYNSTQEIRDQTIGGERILFHSFDNYNRYHPYSIQRGGNSGVYHIGIVFNAIMALEFRRPIGTILKNIEQDRYWRVRKSSLLDCRTNEVELEEVDGKNHNSTICVTALQTVKLTPSSIDWAVVSMPGALESWPITYIDQAIPPSLRQRMPIGLSDCQFVLGNRAWMTDPAILDNSTTMEQHNPRTYMSQLEAVRRIQEFIRFNERRTATTDSADGDDVSVFFDKFNELLGRSPSIKTNANGFQKDCLGFWNESYGTVTKFVWLKICPRDEMKADEFILAMVQIFCSLGLIKEEADGTYSRVEKSNRRVIFQFGDALSVQKWYALRFHILSKMTDIGKEDYVAMMMDAHDRFVICHDYLHENIHRLQVIYKLFYGGFIQVAQVLLGTTKVQKDPTKGVWKHHEWLALKIFYALEKICMKEFICHRSTTVSNLFDSGLDDADICWRLQSEYHDYCEGLLTCPCQKTRVAARFMKWMNQWQLCTQAVSVGDWCSLEIQGHDWLTTWIAMKKNQYKLETVRRLEAINRLTAEEREYFRTGRFVRLHEGKGCIANDDLCEKHNQAEKRCPSNPNFEIVCERSANLHAAMRCAKEVFVDKDKHSTIPKLDDDVNALLQFFRRTEVFVHPNTPSELHDNSFWDHFGDGKVFDGTTTKQTYTQNKHVGLHAREKEALGVFMNKEALNWDNECDADEDNDHESVVADDAQSVGSIDSCQTTSNDFDLMDMMGFSHIDFSTGSDEIDATPEHDADDVVDDPDAVMANVDDLLKQGRLTKYKINMMCLEDVPAIGMDQMPDFVATRSKERAAEKRKAELYYDCNKYFRTKRMKVSVDGVKARMKSLEEPQRELMSWEVLRETSFQAYEDGDIEVWEDES